MYPPEKIIIVTFIINCSVGVSKKIYFYRKNNICINKCIQIDTNLNKSIHFYVFYYTFSNIAEPQSNILFRPSSCNFSISSEFLTSK